MNPKISIVTIAYNCEKEIEETILSVINQQYDNKEYLIIDGASKDGTMDIVDKYRDKIDVIISEPDKGRSDAFNKGIAHATGDYIVMMNAGDLLADDALNKFAKNFEPGYDVIKGNTIRWNEKTGFKSIEYPVIKYPAIPFNFLICHQSTYISKSAYERYGGYGLDYKVVMDFDLMLRFTQRGAQFRKINEDLAIFRMGGISQTSGQRRFDEMKRAMLTNGHSYLNTAIFMGYLHIRTCIRNILNKINPDLKNLLITKKVE
mgnify:FL=1